MITEGSGPIPGPGSRLGTATLIRPIGTGGMGTVFLARDDSGADVAVKVLHSGDERARERFRREVSAIQAVGRHPSIVGIQAFDADAPWPWLAMDFIDGESLAERLERAGPLDPEALWPLGAAIADALQFLHTRGLVHRDLKPQNVFLRRDDGAPMLGDFGLAWRDDLHSLTTTGELVGTPTYMAPEAFDGRGGRGPSLDIWALGCLLYECATGRPPFLGSSAAELVGRICSLTPPSPSDVHRPLPSGADRLILACLEKEPEDRPASAALAEDLRTLARGETLTSSEGASAAVRPGPRLLGILLIALIPLIAGGGLALIRYQRRERAIREAVTALRALENRLRSRLPALCQDTDQGHGERLLALLPGRTAPAPKTALSPALLALDNELKRPPSSPREAQLRRQARRLETIQRAERELALQRALIAPEPDASSLGYAFGRIAEAPNEAKTRLQILESDGRKGELARLGLAMIELRAGNFQSARDQLPTHSLSPALKAVHAELRLAAHIGGWIAELDADSASDRSLCRQLDALLEPEALARDPAAVLDRVNKALAARLGGLPERGELSAIDGRCLRRCLVLLDDHPKLRFPSLPAQSLKTWAETLHRQGDHGPDQIARALACRSNPELESEFSFTLVDWILAGLSHRSSKDAWTLETETIRWMSIAEALGLLLSFGRDPEGLAKPAMREWLEQRRRERPEDPCREAWVAHAAIWTARSRLNQHEDIAEAPVIRDAPTFRRRILELTELSEAGRSSVLQSAAYLKMLQGLWCNDKPALEQALLDLDAAEPLQSCDPTRVHVIRARAGHFLGRPAETVLREAEAALHHLREFERRAKEKQLQRRDQPGVWLRTYPKTEMNSVYLEIHALLARLAIDRKDLKSAEQHARAALTFNSKEFESTAILGLVALERDDRAAARAILATIPENAFGEYARRLRATLR